MTRRACLLGVERSLTGKRWEVRLDDGRAGLTLAQRLDLPEVVGRLLAARGVTSESAALFLNPTLRDLLPNPSSLQDMDVAARRLAEAVERGERIAVFGDYDVDGATSAALLHRFLRQLGREPRVYIPDRIAEGYGPNAPALRRLAGEGVKIVVTVDCGITAFEALEEARSAGLETIVVDHHAAEPRLPSAVAVVNPNRLDDDSGLGQLAAVGVTFLLLVALSRELRERGWYGKAGKTPPDLLALLDLVALGTVCDVVPLTGLNRAFVAQGLKVMGQRRNLGLKALADAAGMDEPPGTYHLGFLLGPRVNAGGRVGQAPLGAALLATEDIAAAANIARQLDAYNAERKEIEAAVLDQALLQVEAEGAPQGLVFAASEGWHAGVIGIVASRLKERYNLPALVVALESGVGKGSARSVPGVDLGAAVIAARQAGLLVNGGGHPMAAGLTVAEAQAGELREFLTGRLGEAMRKLGYLPSLGIDAALDVAGANSELLGHLESLAPYGTANAEPRFVLPEVRIVESAVVGENHVRCTLAGGNGGPRLRAIAFRALDTPVGEALLKSRGLPLHLAGKLRADAWRGGDAVQFLIDDAARA